MMSQPNNARGRHTGWGARGRHLLSALTAVDRQFRKWNHHLVAGAVVAAAPAARYESVKPPKQVLTTELHLGVIGLHKRLVLIEEAVEGAAHLHAKVVRVLAAGTTQQLRRNVTSSKTQHNALAKTLPCATRRRSGT